MTEEAALRSAIIAASDEDAPRLAYADWLDENRPDDLPSPATSPSARAEFIRVQCRLTAGAFADEDYANLIDRETDLAVWLNRHDPGPELDPNGETRDLVISENDGCDGEWEYCDRGFPEVMDFSAYLMNEDAEETVEEVIKALSESFASYPARSVRFVDAMTQEIALLVRHPVFAQVRGLSLDGLNELSEEEAVAALAASRYAAGLRRLFINLHVDDGSCEALARSSHFRNLESLTINFPISAWSIQALGQSKWFRRLKHLHLWLGAPLGHALRALADLPRMPRLTSLTLNDAEQISTSTIRRFATSRSFPELARLELIDTHLSADQVLALARGRWPLRHLRLQNCEVRKSGAEAIAAAPFASSLQVLELPWCQITSSGVRALAESESLSGLRRLDLEGNPIGPSGLDAIADSVAWRGLRCLNLGQTDTPRGPLASRYVTRFLSRLDMPGLRHMVLDQLPVGVRGAHVLATAPMYRNLSRLELDSCNLGEAGVKELVGSRNLDNLVVLNVFRNKTGSGAGKLLNPKVLPRLASCQLGSGIPKGTATRLRRRPGIVV